MEVSEVNSTEFEDIFQSKLKYGIPKLGSWGGGLTFSFCFHSDLLSCVKTFWVGDRTG